MPELAIPVLHVTDAARAVAWYARLDFDVDREHRFEPDMPAFVSISRPGGATLHLSEHREDARPNTLVHLRVETLTPIAKEFATTPIALPRAREIHLTDPDGNRLRVGAPHE